MKKTFLLATALLLALDVSAQSENGSNSPYSRYGFGLMSDQAQGFNKGMSGLAYSMRDGKELNAKNPASYSAIDSLSFLFDIGLSLQNANLDANGTKINAKNASFDYLSMGFRASKGLGVSIGVLPYSTIGYKINNTGEAFNNGPTTGVTPTMSYSGDGGLHEVYLGFGWQPLKPLSLGVNGAYLWGDISNTALTSYSESSVASLSRSYNAEIRTYKLDFGLQYEQRISKKDRLTLGLVYGLGHDINRDAFLYTQQISSNTIISGDTLKAANAFQMPHTFGAGLTWAHANRLRVGVDYTLQKWADVRFPTLITTGQQQTYESRTGSFKDMQKITAGVEYIHNPNGLKWKDHIRYKAGFSYSTPYTLVDGNDGPKDYLVSLGVGIPVILRGNRSVFSTSNHSIINVAAQYERVQPKMAGQITEHYLRLSIGISFNERWFMKWKVN